MHAQHHQPAPPAMPPVRYPQLQLPRLELQFGDGSMCWLSQTHHDPLLRSIEVNGEVLVFDLRDVEPLMEAALHEAPMTDWAAVIFFTLRARYGTVAEFVSAAREHAQ